MSQATSGIASYDAFVAHNHRLFGDKVNGKIWIHILGETGEANVAIVGYAVGLKVDENYNWV